MGNEFYVTIQNGGRAIGQYYYADAPYDICDGLDDLNIYPVNTYIQVCDPKDHNTILASIYTHG